MCRLKPFGTDLLLDRPNRHLSNPHRPDPDDLSPDHLLVMLHRLPDRAKGCSRDLFGQAGSLHQIFDPLDHLTSAEPHMTGQIRFLHQADPHRFTMDQAAIASKRLQCMADRVAIVENAATIRFPLVPGNDFRLDLTGPLNHMDDRFVRQLQDRWHLLLQESEKLFVGDNAVLDDFSQTGNPFAARQGAEREGVDQDGSRLLKGPDQILAQPMVHTGLASDAGIDLRDQRGRHLHKRDTSLIDRGGKAGDIADDPAAEGQ